VQTGYHLFSIPIYSTSEREFNKRHKRYWYKQHKQIPDCYTETEQAKIKTDLFTLFHPKNIWLYNQIIGYIRVLLDHPDILFEVYMPLQRKRYWLFSNRKSYCANRHAIGLHFYVGDKTNEQIISEILGWIIDISKWEDLKRRYIDVTVFENIAKYIDFRALNNDVQKEEGSSGKNAI